jgi:hypothetical protein
MHIVSLPSTAHQYHFRVEGLSDLIARYISAYRPAPEAAAQLTAGTTPTHVVPTVFDEDTKQLYSKAMDQIISTYQHARDVLSKAKSETSTSEQSDAHAKLLLPVACETAPEMLLTPRDLPVLFAELTASRLSEAAALQILISEQVDPKALETMAPPAAEQQDSADTTTSELPAHSIDHGEPVRLLMTTMRNELDLLPYILFEQTGLSFDELKREISNWPVAKKLDTYEAYLRQHQATPEARALHPLDHIRYNWDIVTDYTSFTRLQTVLPSTSLLWQPVTPRYGFDIPAKVEEADLVEVYEKCYELSFTLHSALVERGYQHEAQYSLLRGHKLRCMLAHTAREAATMLAARESEPLLQLLHTRLAEIHPILAQYL